MQLRMVNAGLQTVEDWISCPIVTARLELSMCSGGQKWISAAELSFNMIKYLFILAKDCAIG